MKKNKPTDRKRTFTICGLSALCVAVLAGAWFLTREPEREFIPASTEASGGTDTWEENPGTDTSLPDAAAKESTQIQGTASDNHQRRALPRKHRGDQAVFLLRVWRRTRKSRRRSS